MPADSPLLTVVRSLHFGDDRRDLLKTVPESSWPRLLRLTDDARLTLPLALRCSEALPPPIRQRVAASLGSNARRHARTLADWREIAGSLQAREVGFVMLKGLTNWPWFVDEPWHRPQYDFDLYCPADSIGAARDAIAALGYEPILHGGQATDHLPSMVRRTGYKWRGDYFDPALPLLVEIHFRFWDAAREGFAVRSAERFWERRTPRRIGELTVPALHPVDCLSYATWHAVRHLVSRNLRLCHIYELAHFLERSREDDLFWAAWEQVNACGPALVESIAFRLAMEWFGCRTHAIVREQMRRLPSDVNRWFSLFAFSPVLALEHVNKDELFLQLCLIPERRNRLRIATQRIFPRTAPHVVLDAHQADVSAGLKIRRALFAAAFVMRRALLHVSALWSVGRSALRWRAR
ncbi:MAG: nucleotidyltransferase family protein [Acidobacteriota bacterium]